MGAYAFAMTYDHNGNRLTRTLANPNGSYADTYAYQKNAYNGNLHTDELLSVTGSLSGSKAYTYDQDGDPRSLDANGVWLYLTTDEEDRDARFDFNAGPGAGSVYECRLDPPQWTRSE